MNSSLNGLLPDEHHKTTILETGILLASVVVDRSYQIQLTKVYFMANDTVIRVQKVLQQHAELSKEANSLNSDDDLFAAGMSSRATVGVMLGLESEFDIEFPDSMLRRDVFESIRSISTAVESLTS